MKFKEYYQREILMENIKLISEGDSQLIVWGYDIAKILDVDFQGLWDREGVEDHFPNEVMQFTDSRGSTHTTFTISYIDGMSFDELLNKVKEKLYSKRKDFELKTVKKKD